MKTIQLTHGKVALVDDADFERLNQFKWQASFNEGNWYATRTDTKNNRKTVRMHREVMGVTDPKIQVDHVDGNGLNNQRHNLRRATNAQNQFNRKTRKDAASGFKGVHKHSDGRWRAQIAKDKKNRHIGLFDTPEAAARAYDKEACKERGEYARTNFGCK